MVLSHTTHLNIRNTVACGVEMLGHRKPRSVVAYTLEMFAKTIPEVSFSISDVQVRETTMIFKLRTVQPKGQSLNINFSFNSLLERWSQCERIDINL